MSKLFPGGIKNYIMQSDFLKSISVLFSGNLIANAISFASIPIISRIYNQEAFGEYTVIISLSSILVSIVSFGLTSAIMAPKEDKESKELITLLTRGEIFIILSICVVAVIFPSIIRYFNISLNSLYVAFLFAAYTIAQGVFSLLSVYTNKLKLNRVLFWNALINAMAMFVFTIPFGLLGMKSDGLLLAAILSYTIADLQMIMNTHPFVGKVEKGKIRQLLIKYKHFILYQYPSNLINTFTAQYPNQFFSNRYGKANLGGYAMCERILGVPMRLLGVPINTVYFRQASIFNKEGKDLSRFTFKIISILLGVSILPIIILYLYSEPLFTFILGSGWTEVGKIVSILIIPYFLSFCCNCITYCLVVLDKQHLNLILDIIKLFLVGAALLPGFSHSVDFLQILMYYSWALVIIHILHLLTIFYCLKKHFLKFVVLISVYMVVLLSLKVLLV